MKLAVVSDIHGNLPALEAVMADIARAGAGLVINLGDIVSGPLWPAETADRLMTMAWPTLRGNHERQVLQDPARMGASDRHAAARLTAAHRAWLGSLPATLAPVADVWCCHGTPSSDLDYWLETVVEGDSVAGGPGVRPATAQEVLARAAGAPPGLVLCGHTHQPRLCRLDDGRLIVNPGSVGLPAYDDDRPHGHCIETGSPHARYALVERRGAEWDVRLCAVAYDWEAAARQADAHDRPDWADALRTGRVGTRERDAPAEAARRRSAVRVPGLIAGTT